MINVRFGPQPDPNPSLIGPRTRNEARMAREIRTLRSELGLDALYREATSAFRQRDAALKEVTRLRKLVAELPTDDLK